MTVSVLVAAAVTAGLVGLLAGPGADRTAPAAGPSATAADPSGPAPTSGPPGPSGAATSGAPTPSSGTAPRAAALELSVPSLGIRSAVAEVAPVDGVVDPPRLDRAYVIQPYGRPGSDNTTYIAGHSWNRGDAVFNPLLDVPTQESAVQVGETVVVTQDGHPYTYRVSSSRRYPKGTLAEQDEVWRKVPGRLVLITCFQRNDGAASRDNLVVVAELVEGPAPVAAG